MDQELPDLCTATGMLYWSLHPTSAWQIQRQAKTASDHSHGSFAFVKH